MIQIRGEIGENKVENKVKISNNQCEKRAPEDKGTEEEKTDYSTPTSLLLYSSRRGQRGRSFRGGASGDR